MPLKIAVAGKGGTGKTTLAGGLAFYFSERYKVIAVDSDPSMNLHTALGVENPEPISELKDLIKSRTVVTDGIYNMNPKVEDIPDAYSTSTADGRLKLMVMGTVEKGGEGCMCPESTFLRALLRHLVLKRDEVLILDTEAGIEHFGRKTAEGFDVMLILCEPSVKAIQTANRIYVLSKEIGINKIYAIANKIASDDQMNFIKKELAFEILSFIPYDDEVIKADMLGEPLTDRHPHPKALQSIEDVGKTVEKSRQK
ncbi:MAG: AAA family ATPase [Candidatus Hydrothermarchaeaceae archaeon]